MNNKPFWDKQFLLFLLEMFLFTFSGALSQHPDYLLFSLLVGVAGIFLAIYVGKLIKKQAIEDYKAEKNEKS